MKYWAMIMDTNSKGFFKKGSTSSFSTVKAKPNMLMENPTKRPNVGMIPNLLFGGKTKMAIFLDATTRN